MPMVSTPFLVALLALCVSLAAIPQLMSSVDHQLGPMTLFEAAQALMLLAAMGGLHAAVASIYRRLYRGAAADAAAGTEVAAAILSAVVGFLVQIFDFDPAAQGHDDGGARAAWEEEELEMAAAHVLPAAATATFFLGVGLLFVHLRAGGGEVAGEGFVQILVKMVLGAVAVLVGLMAQALA